MNIEVYTLCWNEADIMPYFLRHYSNFANRIIVYDNESTDGTQDIVRACPIAELRTFSTDGKLDDFIFNTIYNECWKGSKADYVICVDSDEFLVNANMTQFLTDCKANGVDVPTTEGYTMVSEEFKPSQLQIYDIYQDGFRDWRYDKPAVFDPRLDFKLGIGSHWGYIEDKSKFILSSFEPIFLLHYKYMGRERYIKKRTAYDGRLSEYNLKNNLGIPPDSAEQSFDFAIQSAARVVF